jgi:predicted ATPase/class 3 adenylate cyclase
MAELPIGTVTFLLTDVEGSTRLWEQHPTAMRTALTRHDALVEETVARHAGAVVRPRGEGDSRFAVFARASDAIAAAVALQLALHAEPWPTPAPLRVRMAVHTGEADLHEGDYYGAAVNRCARLRGIAHGGQTLLSQTTYDLARAALPATAVLHDLGEHRLRDLAAAERIFQLTAPGLPDTFPPVRSLDGLPNNLPRELTSFVGRERELADVKRLLADSPLVTLTGTGGCGKTRLALQVAANLLDAHPDGVWFVDLAPLADPALVSQAVAAALGVRDMPDRPLLAALGDFLHGRELLLLLDNCEHLLAACAHLADALLRAGPRVRLLATSRELLGIAGETAWRVPSLSLPDPQQPPPVEHLRRYEAVQLFLERARAALPSFVVTNHNVSALVQICRRLDGIPLAIELAAARVRVLTVEQLAARLDDRFRLLTGGSRTALRRQQTLQATIDWSYQLLSEDERALLRRLAVFAGGWTLEAAEGVTSGVGLDPFDVLNLLTGLVDKSMVVAEGQVGEGRYRLLETIRQYALKKLDEAGEARIARRAHRDWFLDLAEQALLGMEGNNQKRWWDRLGAELGNLRAALTWSAAEPGDGETLLWFASFLPLFWHRRGHRREAIGWLETALERGEATRRAARARALTWLGHFLWLEGQLERAEQLLEEAVVVAREVGDRRLLSRTLRHYGVAVLARGNRARARQLEEEALEVSRAAAAKREIAMNLVSLAVHHLKERTSDEVEALLIESMVVGKESGDLTMVCEALSALSWLNATRGDFPRARRMIDKSLILARQIEVPALLFNAYLMRGEIARAEQDLTAAATWYRTYLRDVLATPIYHTSAHATLSYTLRRYAAVCAALGHPRPAATLFSAAAGPATGWALATDSYVLDLSSESDDAMAPARQALGEEEFARAWAEGQAMTLEQAVAYALSEEGDA